MGFNTIEFVTGRVTGRVSKKAKKGDIRLSDNWFSDNCPALDKSIKTLHKFYLNLISKNNFECPCEEDNEDLL